MLETFKIKTAKQYNELQEDRDALLAKVIELENEIANLKSMSIEMTNKQIDHNNVIAQLKSDSDKAIETTKADYDKQISELKTQVVVEANNSEAKAISVLAQVGVAMDDLPKASNVTADNSPEAKLNTFLAMPHGAERTAFYSTNRVDIVRASNARASNRQ
jgi:hypothetical protein